MNTLVGMSQVMEITFNIHKRGYCSTNEEDIVDIAGSVPDGTQVGIPTRV
jgi:hypothetical protein